MNSNQSKPRNWYYKTLQVAKRELGMSDDEYRSVLYANGAKMDGDKFSAKTMSLSQLEAALEQMKQAGFKMRATKESWRKPLINKCKALWFALFEAGVMRQPYSEAVLTKFAYRHTGVNYINWAKTHGLRATIEALKAMAIREGIAIETK